MSIKFYQLYIKLITIIHLFIFVGYATIAQPKVEKKKLSNGKTEVKTYYQSGELFQHYFEVNKKKDSTFTQWFKNGQKQKEYSFKNGIKDGTWVKWYREDGRIYMERKYEMGSLSSQCKYTLRKNGKVFHLEEKNWKGDSLIEKRATWYHTLDILNNLHIEKSYKNQIIIQHHKSWDKKGILREEDITTYKKSKKNVTTYNKKWNNKGKLLREEWMRNIPKKVGEVVVYKEKLLRRKTYKGGKLIKDEKFE